MWLARYKWFFVLAALFAARIGACAVLEIQIRNTFGDGPLQLDSLKYKTASGEELSFSRISYLLGGFALEREEGGWVELTNRYAWLDAEKRRSSVTIEDAPPGLYRAFRFHIGPDPVANAMDPAKYAPDHALNPNLNGLHWSWQGGFIF